MTNQLRVGHVGAPIRATIKEDGAIVDISTVTVKTFKFAKPTGDVIERTPVFEPDGVNGILKYTTVDGDLDQAGPWQLQAYVEFASGKWHTEIHTFHVAANLS